MKVIQRITRVEAGFFVSVTSYVPTLYPINSQIISELLIPTMKCIKFSKKKNHYCIGVGSYLIYSVFSEWLTIESKLYTPHLSINNTNSVSACIAYILFDVYEDMECYVIAVILHPSINNKNHVIIVNDFFYHELHEFIGGLMFIWI